MNTVCGSPGTDIIAVIQQGDQYYLPFHVTDDNGDTITSGNVDNIMIKIGDVAKSVSEETLLFSGERWLYPLTREDSLAWHGPVKCQAAYRRGKDVHHSPVYTVLVDTSIIFEEV